MKVLLIGGTLYFGKMIVRSLLERGDDVTIYSRGNSRPEFWNECGHIIGDRTEYDKFVSDISGRNFDAVIDNLAFKVEDVQAVTRALRGTIGKYIVASTVSIYGGPGHAHNRPLSGTRPLDHTDQFIDLASESPMTENSINLDRVSWSYDERKDAYAQGKRQIERYLAESTDFPWVVLRVPATMGPEDPTLRFWWYQQRIQDGGPIILRDGGINVFRLGFRDDIAQAFISAMDSSKTVGNVYNICQDETPTQRQYLEAIARSCGVQLNVVNIPGDACDQLSGLPWNDWGYDPFFIPTPYVMSNVKAHRDFPHSSTPMAEWIYKTVKWYQSNPVKGSFNYSDRDAEIFFAKRWKRDHP